MDDQLFAGSIGNPQAERALPDQDIVGELRGFVEWMHGCVEKSNPAPSTLADIAEAGARHSGAALGVCRSAAAADQTKLRSCSRSSH